VQNGLVPWGYGTLTRKNWAAPVTGMSAGLAVPIGCQSTPGPDKAGLAKSVPPAGVQETEMLPAAAALTLTIGRTGTTGTGDNRKKLGLKPPAS